MDHCHNFPARVLRFAIAALIFAVLGVASVSAQISGTFTIGSGGTYATFTDAATALGAGVNGPVTFNVLTGTYTEQFTIPAVSGVSATNRITFQAQTGNAADVTLRFTPTSGANYIVYLNGADYVTFTKMTFAVQGAGSYGVIFRLAGDANNNTISNSILSGINVNSSSAQWANILVDNQPVDQLTVSGNTINYGSVGVYFDGVNTTTRSDSTKILNNTISYSGYAGIILTNHNSCIVSGNVIDQSISRGIQMYYCHNDIQVVKNKVTNTGAYGLILQYSNGGTGFPPQGLVANNMIQVGANGAGIYLYQCTNQFVYYNSVNMTGGNSSAYYGLYNPSNIVVQNNVFANFAAAYAANIYSGSDALDYNNLLTTGNYLGRITSTDYADLAAWQAAGKDPNSFSYYPGFTSSTNLHTGSTWLNGKATPVTEVSDDIDGHPRDGSTPDLGADEYVPTVAAPLSGAYSVGAGQTFTTFRAAAAALQDRGVSGPVTFNVVNGTYNDHFVLLPISGASETNTITFQSATNVTAGVTLVFNAAAPESNYVVLLANADYVKFHKMTVRGNNNTGANYSTVFYLSGGVDNFTLDSCNVFGYASAGNSTNYSLVYAGNVRGSNPTFIGNTFNSDAYGIYWDGLSNSALTSGLTVMGNTFLNQTYTSLYVRYADRPQIIGNTVTGSGSRGIDLAYCQNDMLVAKNKVTGAGSYGIMAAYCNGGTGFPPQGLIVNNFVQSGANSSGIYLYQSTNQYVYFNSVNITGGNSQAYYDAYSNATIAVTNNNFVNFGGGYAVNTYSSSDVMDYNNLFTSGNYIGRSTNTDFAALANWQSATGRDANSISVYPSFTSNTNLHTGSTFLNGRGTPLPEVFDDIDGESRDGLAPDIGADEYSPTILAPLSGTYTVGAGQNYTTIRSAAAALQSRGVSGPVTFNISNGTYNEHFSLYSVPGASETNTVTFQSTSNNAAGVTMVFNAAAPESNYVVQLINADYIKFHKMTLRGNNNTGALYSIVFYLAGGVDNFTLDSCNVFGYSAATSSLNYALVYASNVAGDNASFIGNTFNTGSYGIYWDGLSNTDLTQGLTVMGNTFLSQGYTGLYVRYADHPLITTNTITGSASRGMDLAYCQNDLVVTRNKVTNAGSYGIMIQYSNGGTGFPPQGLTANNFVQAGGNSTGIYLYQSTNQYIYNNSVNITGANSQAYYDAYSNASIVVKNNVFANLGGGYAVNTYSSADEMDNNAYYAIGNMLARSTNTDYIDLAAWQAGTSRDANSIFCHPGFVSTTNLHSGSHFLDARGLVLPEIFVDIDGEGRENSTPDIGADEFTPDGATIPLAGTYTIGSGGSFPNWKAAASALTTRGISDAVTFNVLPGTYQESVVFYPVSGSSAGSTITFQSSSGNPVGTLLSSVTTAESSFVTLFYGADHFRFKNLSFRTNTNVGALYGIGFYLWGNVDDMLIDRCIISGVPASSSSANYAIIYASNAVTRDIHITNNVFNDGGYGVYLDAPAAATAGTGTMITGNTINNADYTGIYLHYQDAPTVRGNTIINADVRGIEMSYCYNGYEVTKNKIITDGGAYGIYNNWCASTVQNPGLVANNFITCLGSNSAGFGSYYSTYVRFLFNSVNVLGTNSEPLYSYGGSANSNDYMNNNLVNASTGYAMYVASPEGIGQTNYNNLKTAGATLAYWTGDRANLAALQSASGKDANSRSVVAGYYSTTNLHTTSVGLDSAATPLASVADDFDGEPRDANNPDIGADEFSPIVTSAPQVPGGWNMISLPLSVIDNRKNILFPTSNSNAFAYEPPAGYVTKDSLKPMVGYWLKFPAAQTLSITGAPVLRDSAITRAGWNLIGSIAVPIPKTSILQAPAANVASNYFEYVVGTGYVTADTLKPGKAFWVKTNLAGKLTLDVSVVPPKAVATDADARAAALDALNELSFSTGESGSAKLYFGASVAPALRDADVSLPPAPPTEAADVRFDGDRYVALVAGTAGQETPLFIQGTGTVYTMTYTMREASGLSYVLVERSASATREIPLSGSGSVRVSSAKRYAIRVQELPSEFRLAQNFPNPFNPSTTIRFDLPVSATVSLRVYTMLGQEVALPLENATMERGSHVVTLDARTWSSGTYIYRLQAVDASGAVMSATRKMLFLK